MRNLTVATTVFVLLAGIARAQIPSTPAVPAVPPRQITPEVIVPPSTIDPGVLVAPRTPAAADPNSIVPGRGGLGLSEIDARKTLEESGYSGITNLMRRLDGGWTARALKGGAPVKVLIDRMGKVTPG